MAHVWNTQLFYSGGTPTNKLLAREAAIENALTSPVPEDLLTPQVVQRQAVELLPLESGQMVSVRLVDSYVHLGTWSRLGGAVSKT